MFEPELFLKQIHCIEESTCDIFGAFRHPAVIRRPHSDSAPGELLPLASFVTPLRMHDVSSGSLSVLSKF